MVLCFNPHRNFWCGFFRYIYVHIKLKNIHSYYFCYMISFIAKTQSGKEMQVNVPSTWHDVTFDTYVQLINFDNGTIEKRISILLGWDEQDVLSLPIKDMIDLIPAISFTFDVDELKKYTTPPDEYKNWYIGHQAWSKLEQCKQILTKLDGKDIMNAGVDVVKIYTDKDISKMPVTEALPMASFFLTSCINFISVLLN